MPQRTDIHRDARLAFRSEHISFCVENLAGLVANSVSAQDQGEITEGLFAIAKHVLFCVGGIIRKRTHTTTQLQQGVAFVTVPR